MGTAVSKTTVTCELEELKQALDNNDISGVMEENSRNLDLLEKTTLDIAITGVSGAGKSSLVNALRGMTDYEEGAAETGVTETTMEQQKYPHPTFPKVTIWDLPGIGTPKFKAQEYLEKVHFQDYDFFIILGTDRFTENDVLLAQEIQKLKKKFYYVRTKVDVSLDSERKKPNFCEEKCLEKIRTYCCENLAEAGESNPRVFLISRWDLSMYDFPHLQVALENYLVNLKRNVLIETMPDFSRELQEKKKAAMKALIWKVATVSCGTGAVPVPGLSFGCDTGILVSIMKHFCKVFGLNDDSLHRLANRVGKPVDVLRSAIKKSPVASQITTELVIDLLTQSLLCGTTMAVELALDFVPVLDSLNGGALSFVTTFYMLKNFLYDVVEDSENVRAKAAELQDK